MPWPGHESVKANVLDIVLEISVFNMHLDFFLNDTWNNSLWTDVRNGQGRIFQ